MEPHVQRHFEWINAQIQEAQYKAERKCAHIYAGNVEMSPQFKEAYNLIEFWMMTVDRFRGKVINWQNFQKMCQWHMLIYSLDISEVKEGLQKAHKFWRQVKKKDNLLQIEHLSKLAMEKEQHGDK